jgi:hypothetical protein
MNISPPKKLVVEIGGAFEPFRTCDTIFLGHQHPFTSCFEFSPGDQALIAIFIYLP